MIDYILSTCFVYVSVGLMVYHHSGLVSNTDKIIAAGLWPLTSIIAIYILLKNWRKS